MRNLSIFSDTLGLGLGFAPPQSARAGYTNTALATQLNGDVEGSVEVATLRDESLAVDDIVDLDHRYVLHIDSNASLLCYLLEASLPQLTVGNGMGVGRYSRRSSGR